MEFRTYTIEANPDKTVNRFTYIILLLVLGVIVCYILKLETIATVLFAASVIIIIVLAIVKKGRIQSVVVSKNVLAVGSEKIVITGRSYDLKKIKQLAFTIDSFAGMDSMTQMGQVNSDGMENYVKFIYDAEKVQCRFYLQDRNHALTLCKMFDEFYRLKIPFIEKDNRGRQTYLFRRLDNKQLQDFKKKYGY